MAQDDTTGSAGSTGPRQTPPDRPGPVRRGAVPHRHRGRDGPADGHISALWPPIIGCLIGPLFALIGEARTMEVTQDILLPVLVAAVIANTVILLLLIVVVTRRRRQRHARRPTQSVLQGSLLSTSYVDRSADPPLPSGGQPAFDEVADDADAPADPEDADAVSADLEGDPHTDGDRSVESAEATESSESVTDGERERTASTR